MSADVFNFHSSNVQAGWKEPLLEDKTELGEVSLTLYLPTAPQTTSQTTSQTTTDKVLELIRSNPKITKQEIAETLGRTPRAIQSVLSKLKTDGRIRRIGPTTFGGHWEVLD